MHQFVNSLRWEYLKWIQSIKMFLIKNIIYKVNFILMMIIPILIFFFIKYNLWVSIYEVNSVEILQGYTLDKMIRYQFGIVLLDLFVRSHFFSQNLSRDIRLGKISSFLIYPFHFISYQLSRFVSDKILQSLIGSITFFIVLYFDFIEIKHVSILFQFFLFVILINIFWFFMQIFIGFLAFWIEETWSLNVAFRFIVAFLSGAFIPLELYPEFFKNVLVWTPFPYLTYYPVKILMGDEVPLLFCLFIISSWICLIIFITRKTWNKGLEMYTGSGI